MASLRTRRSESPVFDAKLDTRADVRKEVSGCGVNPGRQALLVPAYLRKGDTFVELAAGFGIGTARALAVAHQDGSSAGRSRPEAGPGTTGRGRPGTPRS